MVAESCPSLEEDEEELLLEEEMIFAPSLTSANGAGCNEDCAAA